MDHRQFIGHFLREEPTLRAYLTAAVRDFDVVDDLLQEIGAVMWESFDRFDPRLPFRPWALGFARIQVLKWKQKIARSRKVFSDEALELLARTAAETGDEADSRRPWLRECLERLGEHVRSVVKLRYLESLSIARTAERTGKSVAAIEMTLVRARRALRECVQRRISAAGEDD
jgi:RNA polymerase sigma-70 factor (ECF subfamily)